MLKKTLVFLILVLLLLGSCKSKADETQTEDHQSEETQTAELIEPQEERVEEPKTAEIKPITDDPSDINNMMIVDETTDFLTEEITLATNDDLTTEIQESKKAIEKLLSDDEITEDMKRRARELYNKGVSHYKKLEYDQAIDLYQQALDIVPNYYYALGNMGLTYRMMGDLDQAINYYEKVIHYFPQDYYIRLNLAAVHILKKDFQAAEKQYQEMIKIDRKGPEGYYGMGRSLIYQKKYEEAFKYLENAIKIYKNIQSTHLFDCYFLLGFSYYETNNYAFAIENFESAYLAYESSAQLNYFLGISYLSITPRETKKARLYFSKALELGFDIPERIRTYLTL
ncbi:MAG: tetratricopeptide repeat protein [Spirochaetes bacterium]|nr:tetratricopeptide repeat protein [Spirochaetota bacterium]